MLKVKTRMRLIVFLLLTLVICAYTNVPIFGSFDPLTETAAGNESSGIPSSFYLHRQVYSIVDVCENPQIMRITSDVKAENAGRVSNTRSALIASHILLSSIYELSKTHKPLSFFAVNSPTKAHLSVLAFSLGGNSPPVYHA